MALGPAMVLVLFLPHLVSSQNVYTENAEPMAVHTEEEGLTIDVPFVSAATVTIMPYDAEDYIHAPLLLTELGYISTWDPVANKMTMTHSTDASDPGRSGAEYAAALLELGYGSGSESTEVRFVEYSVVDASDGLANILPSWTVILKQVIANDRPSFLELQGKVAYSLGSVMKDGCAPALIIKDDDSPFIKSASVAISKAYMQGFDSLQLPPAYETEDWNTTWFDNIGTLRVSGNHSRIEYQNMLRAVRFHSTQPPEGSIEDRRITYQAHDFFLESELGYWAMMSILVTSREIGWNVQIVKGNSTELGEEALVRISLINEPVAPILASITTDNGQEANVRPSFIVLTSANWNEGIMVYLEGKADNMDDGDIHYNAVASVMITQDPDYLKLLTYNAPLINIDDPANDLVITPWAPAGTDHCITTEIGGTFEVFLNVTHWWDGYQPFQRVIITATTDVASEGMIVTAEEAGVVTETAVTGQVTFGQYDNHLTQSFKVQGVDDSIADGDRPFTVTFEAVLYKFDAEGVPRLDGQLLFSRQITDFIKCSNIDNDVAEIVWVLGCDKTSEGGDECSLGAYLTSRPFHDVRLATFSSNPLEGKFVTGMDELYFTPDTWSSTQYVRIRGVEDDGDTDGDVSYTVTIGPAKSDDAKYYGKVVTHTMVNIDNDLSTLTVEKFDAATVRYRPVSDQNSAALRVNEMGYQASFYVKIPTMPTAPVTVTLSVTDDSEASLDINLLVFLADASHETRQMVTLTGIDDLEMDGNMRFGTTLDLTSDDVEFNGINWRFYMLNEDDDGIVLEQTSCQTYENAADAAAAGPCHFGVKLPFWSPEFTEVEVAIINPMPTEGTASHNMLVFGASNWNDYQYLTITGLDDPIADGDVMYEVGLNPKLSYTGFDGTPQIKYTKEFTFSVTNIDDDVAGIAVQQFGNRTDENGDLNISFTVVLMTEPHQPFVEVPVSTSNLLEGQTAVDKVTFTKSNWNTKQTVFVHGFDDSVEDDDQDYKIFVGPIATNDPGYLGLSYTMNATNLDNDHHGIFLNMIHENTTEWGGIAQFRILLTSEPTAPILFAVASRDMTEAIVDTALLVVAADNWDIGVVVTVVGQADGEFDGNQFYAAVVTPMITQDEKYLQLSATEIILRNIDDPSNLLEIYTTTQWCLTSELDSIDPTRTPASVKLTLSHWRFAPLEQPWEYVDIIATAANNAEGMVTNAAGTEMLDETVLRLLPENWDQGVEVFIKGVDDGDVDGTQNFTIALRAQVKVVGVDAPKAVDPKLMPTGITCANSDNDVPGIIVVPECQVTTESLGECNIGFKLKSRPTSSVTIPLDTNSPEGLVTAPFSKAVVFARSEWNTIRYATIQGQDDPEPDDTQPYTVVVGPAVSTDPLYSGQAVEWQFSEEWNSPDPAQSVGSTLMVPFENTDNDVANLEVSQDGEPLSGLGKAVDETGLSQSFQLRLPNPPTSLTKLHIVCMDTTEGMLDKDVIEFTAANYNLWQSVKITGVDDEIEDGQVRFEVRVTSESADPNYKNLLWGFVMDNLDDDNVLKLAKPNCTVSESGAQCTLGIMLNDWKPYYEMIDLTLSVASQNADEIQFFPKAFDFVSKYEGTALVEKLLGVQGLDDAIVDGDQIFDINIDATLKYTHHGGGTKSVSVPSILVTNVDDDTPGLVFVTQYREEIVYANITNGTNDTNSSFVYNVPLPYITNEYCGTSTSEKCAKENWFRIKLLSEPLDTVTIPVRVSDVTEGKLSNMECPRSNDKCLVNLVFDQSNWDIFEEVLLTGVDDFVKDYDVSYQVTIGPTSSNDGAYQGMVRTIDAISIDDDDIGLTLEVPQDKAGLYQNKTSEDGTKTGALKVRLLSEPKDTVLFTVSSTKPAEAAASPSIVAFSPDNWFVVQYITVRGVDDQYSDGAQEYYVVIDTLFTEDPDYGAPKEMGGMLRQQALFENEDDPFDRSERECQLGFFGSTITADNLPCTKCPAGTYATTTRDALFKEATMFQGKQFPGTCKKCMMGTASETDGATFGPTDNVHPCQPCRPDHQAPERGLIRCTRCPKAEVDDKTALFCDTLASTYPMTRNISNIDGAPLHAWLSIVEEVYSQKWAFGPFTVAVNEEKLQVEPSHSLHHHSLLSSLAGSLLDVFPLDRHVRHRRRPVHACAHIGIHRKPVLLAQGQEVLRIYGRLPGPPLSLRRGCRHGERDYARRLRDNSLLCHVVGSMRHCHVFVPLGKAWR
jgi:hypothetical protein